MTTPFVYRERRQAAYIKRAKSARYSARLLMPVAMIAISTSVWSDPVLGPQLSEGVTEIRPVLAEFLVDTPLEDLLGPVPEKAPETENVQQAENIAIDDSMPRSLLPVNRPANLVTTTDQ